MMRTCRYGLPIQFLIWCVFIQMELQVVLNTHRHGNVYMYKHVCVISFCTVQDIHVHVHEPVQACILEYTGIYTVYNM